MLNEKNIPRLIFLIPFLGILLSTFTFTYIIVKSEYNSLKEESNQIRQSYIQHEKKDLKKKIHEVLNFIKYSPSKNNKELLQKSVVNFIDNIIIKDRGYLYIIDNKANIIYHPAIKKGTNVINIKDKNGLYVAKSIISISQKHPEGDYLSYYWTSPGTTIQTEKTAFIYYIKEWNWIISIGSYMDLIEKQIDIRTAHKKELLNENITNTMIISFIITIILLALTFLFSKKISRIFIKYKKEVSKKEKILNKLNQKLQETAKKEIFKRSEKEEELKSAYKEILTGLPNRMKLQRVLIKAKKPKLAILNIDRFTDLNHYYSPKTSDKLLKSIAKLLTNLAHDNEDIVIFKLPVDEYAIFTDSKIISDEDFIELCKTMIRTIEDKPFLIDTNNIIVSITGGISLTNKNVIINADTALKIAKSKHKTCLVYNEEDNVEINYQNNVKWTKILKNAIKEDRVVVFKQPIINNSNDSDKKYECLIRIEDTDGSIISPYHFLDLSKKLKLYHQLTRIVIEKSFKHFKTSTAQFSINLTLDDIMNKETVKFIKDKLSNQDIAKRVIFEIVESEGIDNFDEVSLFIKEVKSFGCKIAIDDFGTGYSNFEYLMKLNADFIKIDGSFIKNIDSNEQSVIISELIVSFAKKQNISTVAEFVHSADVLKKVKELGVDYSQGYYLGEPTKLD